MKKLSLIVLALCTLLAAGALYAADIGSGFAGDVLAVSSSAVAAPACGAFSTPSWAAASGSAARTCPFEDLVCATIFDPVICASDGQVYSNACVAKRNCAFGCIPYSP